MWSAFYLRLNVPFFKEQGECREAAWRRASAKVRGQNHRPFWGGSSGLGLRSARAVGTAVGAAVGVAVGSAVGVAVGSAVGVAVGSAVGVAVGSAVGVAVGSAVGVAVGSAVGVAVGSTVGVAVGFRGRGQLGRGDGEGGIQPVSVACHRQVLDGCTGRRRVLYGACYGCYFIISRL